jgi:hypothetical protein
MAIRTLRLRGIDVNPAAQSRWRRSVRDPGASPRAAGAAQSFALRASHL